ncbi:MAG: sucrase ferredoxin [Anaerolineales bacterium]|nr:sucrase ferredoxin [Anaerolineales bacterium]
MATPLEKDPTTSCGSSREVDEQVGGTATTAYSWIALEVPKPWGRKALPESDLPEAVKSHLSNAADELDGGRVLFITRDDRKQPDRYRMYLARSREGESRLRLFEFEAYEELLDIDFSQAIDGRGQVDLTSVDEPVFLFCTNGKRDPCCARIGLAAYRSLADDYPERVWQSSHQGGHRFAGNLIVLPYGVQYGRVEAHNADQIIAATERGEILLAHYRGRTLYEAPAQAAEYYLRTEHNLRAIDALRLASLESGENGRTAVRFEAPSAGDSWQLETQEYTSDYLVFKTTGDEEQAHATRHRVERAKTI